MTVRSGILRRIAGIALAAIFVFAALPALAQKSGGTLPRITITS